MFRPWLRVAQPDDWTGGLVRVASWPVYFMVLLPIAIGRIPTGMRILGFEELTRLVIALVALYLLGWLRALAFSLLPRAVVQYGGRVWFRHGGRRMVVRTAEITKIDVELRPSGEVFVIELGDQIYDLCPVAWEGAQRIFKVLHRRVVRARRRLAREQRRGEAGKPA